MMGGVQHSGVLFLVKRRMIVQEVHRVLQDNDYGFDAFDKSHRHCVIDHWHKHPPDMENGPARDRAGAGVQKSHHYLAAALLALQLGHNAATPT